MPVCCHWEMNRWKSEEVDNHFLIIHISSLRHCGNRNNSIKLVCKECLPIADRIELLQFPYCVCIYIKALNMPVISAADART